MSPSIFSGMGGPSKSKFIQETEWDSTSVSDGSTTVPDIHARYLRRALDQKVRKVRSMLTADEDITTELDRVVCRLMKLALRTSKGRNTPPPTRWMQCKLLDLLTLTEKTIERRKRHFIESYQLKALNYEEKSQEMIALEKIKEDNTALKIVDKYQHLVNQTDDMLAQYRYELDYNLEDDITVTSTEFTKVADYEFIDQHPTSPNLEPETTLLDTEVFQTDIAPQDTKLQRTQAWVDEDIEVVPYPNHDGIFDAISMDTNHVASRLTYNCNRKLKGKQCFELNCKIRKKSHPYKLNGIESKSKEHSRTKLGKKNIGKKLFNCGSGVQTRKSKILSIDYKNNLLHTSTVKHRRRRYKNLPVYPTVANPIPISLIELCHPEMMIKSDIGSFHIVNDSMGKTDQDQASCEMKTDIAGTEKSMLIEIITEDARETIALRRTIGTDADTDSTIYEDERLIRSVSNTLNEEDAFYKHGITTKNVHSQTIFLYDIDEPTTSKGIRHTGMDVQCGPETTVPVYCTLSATTSLTKVPKMFTVGIKIGDSFTNVKITNTDFGMCTNELDNSHKTVIPRHMSAGIKIKDSDSHIMTNQMELSPRSALSVTTSLVKIPTISTAGIKVSNSNTHNCIEKAYFGASIDNPEPDYNGNLSMDRFVSVKIKDSLSLIPKKMEYVTDSNEPFNVQTDFPKVTATCEPLSVNSLNKKSDKNVSLNNSSSTNTQELYEKLIVSSQKIFETNAKITKNPLGEAEYTNFCSNIFVETENLLKCHEMDRKSNAFLKKTLKEHTTPKSIDKKAVEFQILDSVSNIRTCGKRPNSAPMQCSKLVDHEKTANVVVDRSHPKRSDSCYNTSLPPKLHCLKETDFYDVSRTETTLLPSPKHKSLTVSKIKEVSIGTEDHNSFPVEIMDCLIETKADDASNNAQACLKEATFLEYDRNLKTDNSKCNISVSIDTNFKTSRNSYFNNTEKVVSAANKVANNFRRSNIKNSRLMLSRGGIQVYSYRDKQALCEDIMYQGRWQQNKPKLSRKKGCIPVVNKKNDVTVKKNDKHKEIMASNVASSAEKGRQSYKRNNKLKPELRQLLVPHNKTVNDSEQISDIKENKHNQKTTLSHNTTCVAIVAKPFRNVLRVPSNFPISTLPSTNLKPKNIIRKPQTLSITLPTKKDEKPPKGIRKNYIPLYLRKKGKKLSNKISEADLNLSFDSATSKIKKSKENTPKSLTRSKTEELKRDLLRFRDKSQETEYIVFRNEIEKKKSDGQEIKNTSGSTKEKDVSKQRSSNPNSTNSSSCSSPCSIATVKVIAARTNNVTNRRHSSPSYTNNIPTSGSENSTSERNRQYTKRCKSAKITIENKENIPQTSKNFNAGEKDNTKIVKGIFLNQKKDVYLTKVKDGLQSTANTPSKHGGQKSNVNTPKIQSFNDKKSSPCLSPSLYENSSATVGASLLVTHTNDISESAQTSNMVLIIESQARQVHNPPYLTYVSKFEEANVPNHCFVTKNVDNIDEKPVNSFVHNISSNMRALLEETLDFIDESFDNEYNVTFDLSDDKRENVASHVDSPESATSFKTVVTSDDNNEVLPSDIEYTLNSTFDTTLSAESTLSLNDTHLTVTDFDCLSFKSLTSGSKLSGYLSADTEFSSSIKLPKCSVTPPTSTSVREIFERKDQLFQPAQNENRTGALANQAFSGFSINEDSFAGDKPDLVNLIDSETGSLLAVAIPRQATSEELLISGRSSDSFESCVLDDEAVVPNWLFQLISNQASSLDEIEPPGESNLLPAMDPLFDENANVVEAPGAGAGAGDGHGIHSDQSQDSSGRGTSLSSSETSSGQQSEVILIDPAAFAAQFELLRDAVESSVILAMNNPEGSDNAMGSRQVPVLHDTAPQLLSGGESRRTPRPILTSASDADADVSSLDTDDLPDSSDN